MLFCCLATCWPAAYTEAGKLCVSILDICCYEGQESGKVGGWIARQPPVRPQRTIPADQTSSAADRKEKRLEMPPFGGEFPDKMSDNLRKLKILSGSLVAVAA